MDDPRLPTRSGRFENRMRPARSYTEPRIAMLKEIHTEEQVLFLSTEQSCRTRQCPERPFTRHRTWTWGHHWLHRLRIARLTHTSVHMSWLLSIPRTASAFGINPPFQATQTGPITDGFILHRRRLGRGHHYAHRGDQEHEGEQNTSTNWGLHPQTPVAWTTHAAPTVPHLAQGPMWPTHCGQTQQPQHQGVHVQRTNRTVDRGLDHTACTRERTTCSQELPPYGLRGPAQPEDATMQQLRTTVYVVHATTNETTQYEHVWSRRAQALLLQLLHRSRPDASSRTIRPTRPTGHRKTESLEPESTRLDHGRMRTPSIIRRSRLHPTDLVPCHSTRSSRTTRPCHHHPPLGHRDFAVDQATPHQGRRRPRGLAVLSPRMAAFGQTGMASQEGTGSAGTADTSVHNIQEPPRCPHRDSTEPIQEEGQNGPIGSPRIPCHPGRHGPLDPGASTTSAIGEGLSRLGEGQFHTDGYRPQQRPLGLPRAQGQHYPPSGLSGRRAAEPPPTLYLSEHRLQLCHQGLTDKQGKYLCPRCRTEYRPWAAAAVNNPNKKFCPAAQCLVTKVTSATPPDSDGWAQQLTNHTTSTDTFYLYLMKFPTTNDQKLLNDCKLAVDQVATALSQSPDPQAALLEYINTVLTHAQMLPYFQQHVVSQDILNQVQQANAMRTKQPQWKWEHLPKSTDPNTRVTIYHYQGCRYEWDSEHTKVLEHADVHQLIALTFCKVYLTRFLQLSFKAQRTWVRNIEWGQSTCLNSTELDDRLFQTSFTQTNREPHLSFIEDWALGNNCRHDTTSETNSGERYLKFLPNYFDSHDHSHTS